MPVTPVDIATAFGHNSPALVVDPTDSRFLALAVRIDAPSFGCGLQLSGDGGRGWVGAAPVPALPPGAERCYAPEVAFDRTGRLYYLFVGLHTRGNTPMGVFLTSSTDRGASFSPPRRILGAHVFGTRIAIDRSLGRRGRIHLAFIQASADPAGSGFASPPNPIMAMHSDDGGATFSTPVQVNDPHRLLVTAPALVVGADSAVHVAYYDLGDDQRDYRGLEGPTYEGTWSLVVATSRDSGGHFEAGVVADDGLVPPERVLLVMTMPPPSLASDGTGRLHLSWHDARNDDWDVFVRASPDAGRSWGEARRVNDDPPAGMATQYLPAVAVATNGRVDVVYYDRRNDPHDVRNDVMLSASTDGGDTFAPAVKLNGPSFESRIGARYSTPYNTDGHMVEFGGRLGLVSSDDRATAAWTDTRMTFRNFSNDIFGPTDQAIYANQVDFAPA